MGEITRRQFLEKSLLGAGVLATSPVWAKDPDAGGKPPASVKASDRVELGTTGIVASRLAMGTGMRGWRRSSDHTMLGQKAFSELILHGFDHGLNYIDMADLYGSHQFVRKTLAGIPRDSYVLSSKIWPRGTDWLQPSGGAIKEVNRFLDELGAEMLDICLIHCVQTSKWPEEYKGIRDELSELKEKKVIRAVGCSCHDHGALKVAAEHPWVDVIYARINHKGNKMGDSPEAISKTLIKARENGKAIVGIKIFGEGTLVKPKEKDASLKFVLGNNLVNTMVIGMLSKEEIDDSVARIDKAFKA
ncbi:MAG: aldo/keto reductase [Fidelibacterota bacterium]|nr:MAG: aldo/keto reductase [Candidatus Neomarinimicrobiota bacterium]